MEYFTAEKKIMGLWNSGKTNNSSFIWFLTSLNEECFMGYQQDTITISLNEVWRL